jgi:DNA-binding NarL/FixJ family response regulator
LIRVLLADAHRLLHPGIQAILSTADDLTLIGEVTEGDALRQICQQENRPDLLLLSPNVEDLAATEALDAIRESCPSVKILAMLSHAEEACSRQLMDHGADGVILKSDAPDKLLEAINAVMQSQPWVSAELVAKLVQPQQPDPGNDLTDREVEILQLLAVEKTNEEMAESLNIAERTVRSHLESIYGKLGVKSRAGAVAQAIRLNLIS